MLLQTMNKKQVFQDLLIGTLDAKFALHDPVEMIDLIILCLNTTPRNLSKIVDLLKIPSSDMLQSIQKPYYNTIRLHLLRNLSKVYKLKISIELHLGSNVYTYHLQDTSLLNLLNDIMYFVKIYKTLHYVNCTDDLSQKRVLLRNLSQKTTDDPLVIKKHYNVNLKLFNNLKTEFNIGSYLHIESTTPLYNNNVLNEILDIRL